MADLALEDLVASPLVDNNFNLALAGFRACKVAQPEAFQVAGKEEIEEAGLAEGIKVAVLEAETVEVASAAEIKVEAAKVAQAVVRDEAAALSAVFRGA